MPEWTGVGFDAGHLGPVGVAAEARVWLHVGTQLVAFDEAFFGQRGVQRSSAVAFAQDEAVALGPVWRFGVHLEHREIQRGQNVRRRQVTPDVPEPRAVDHLQIASADVCGELPEPLELESINHGALPSRARRGSRRAWNAPG